MEGSEAMGKLPRARSKRRRRLRTHKLLATLVVLVVVVSLGGGIDLAYASVKSQADQLQANLTSQLQAGQDELEAGKDALKQANSKHDVSFVNQAVAHFAAAKVKFTTTEHLADDSKFLRYLEYAPSVGDFARSRHVAVVAIAQMGSALSDAGQDLSVLDGQILNPTSSREAGRTLLSVLGQTQKGLVKVRGDLATAQKAASRVDIQILPAAQQVTFAKARESIDSALAGFAEFERLVPIVTDILGGNGARTYLVEQVNPAELRAGGGFIGTYSILRADQGSLKLLRSGNAYDLVDPRPLSWQPGFIPMPMPYREVIPQVSWSFVDSNIFPDFLSNAKAAETLVEPRIGHLDGVIAMDYYTVAKLLELTGPMDVPGYSIKVDSSNFVAQAMRHDIAGDEAHKAILSAFAGPLMEGILSLPPDHWPSVITMFNGLASERHLQAYFNNDSSEAEMDLVGWSGRIDPSNYSDFLLEVESNYYGTKSNYWVSRHYSVSLTREGGTLHHSVVVDIVNHEPCGAEIRTLYRSNIRLYVGADAGSLAHNMQRVRYPNPAPPANTKLLDGWLWVGCGGGHSQAAFAYDTPWLGRSKIPHKIYWQKQPGTTPDEIDLQWRDDSGDTYQTHGELRQDLLIELLPYGIAIEARQPAQATLPSVSLG